MTWTGDLLEEKWHYRSSVVFYGTRQYQSTTKYYGRKRGMIFNRKISGSLDIKQWPKAFRSVIRITTLSPVTHHGNKNNLIDDESLNFQLCNEIANCLKEYWAVTVSS